MKVYISNYRDHWLSPYTIIEKVLFWRKKDILLFGIIHFNICLMVLMKKKEVGGQQKKI